MKLFDFRRIRTPRKGEKHLDPIDDTDWDRRERARQRNAQAEIDQVRRRQQAVEERISYLESMADVLGGDR